MMIVSSCQTENILCTKNHVRLHLMTSTHAGILRTNGEVITSLCINLRFNADALIQNDPCMFPICAKMIDKLKHVISGGT